MKKLQVSYKRKNVKYLILNFPLLPSDIWRVYFIQFVLRLAGKTTTTKTKQNTASFDKRCEFTKILFLGYVILLAQS